MAEFLAQAPWDEPQRDRLIATQSDLEKYLNSYSFICCRLTEMLERLLTKAIPLAKSKILQQVHRILQNSMLLSWPLECLRPETCTTGFEDIISEIAQFESQRLGFLFTLKSTLLQIHDKLSNTLKIESTTLHDTFGLFSKISEIFLFTPQPEGFIMTGQYPGLSPLHARYHPLREGHRHASTSLGPVQGMGYRVQPVSMQLRGQHWKHASLDQRETDKQSELSQQAPQIMPSHSLAQHVHIVATKRTTKKQLEKPQKALLLMSSHCNTSWPLTAKKRGELAEFLAQAPWDEQREGRIATQSELAGEAPALATNASENKTTTQQRAQITTLWRRRG